MIRAASTRPSTRKLALLMGGVSALALGAAPLPALAQGVALEEIIVTAQRREQAIQDVGLAITAFTGEDLLVRGIDTVVGLEDFTPNFEVEEQFGNGVPSYQIRGVGFVDFYANNAPTVGIYVDDVAYPLPIMTQGVLFDVERVEILRGPQGTLYGRNTTGGAVKVISGQPTEEFDAGFTTSFERFGRFDFEGFMAGPISDIVRARASVKATTGGAWQENRETGEELGEADQLAGRLIVDIDIAENLLASVNLNAFSDQSENQGLQLFNPSPFGNQPPHTGIRSTSWGASAEFANLVNIQPDEKPFRDNEGYGISARLEAGLSFADFLYIGSFNRLERQEYADWDAVPAGAAGVFFTTEAEVMSHELRLTGTGANVNWVAGALYATEDLEELYQSDFVASFGPGFAVSTPSEQEVETLAVYAHADWALSEEWTLVGGLRYEDEERELNGLGTFATGFGTFNFANGTTDGTLEFRETDFSEVTGKIALEYRPTDTVLAYASFSRGIKSGGFTTANTLNPNAVDPFDLEELLAYEIGVKADPLPNLRTNLALFYYDYRDQQVQSAIFDPVLQTPVSKIINAPESSIWGGELEVLWAPVEGFEIAQALGYKEGEFDEFNEVDIAASVAAGAEVTVDRSGTDIGIPDLTYSGAFTYSRPLTGAVTGSASFDYQYRDSVIRPLLGPVYEVDSYWVANLRASVEDAEGMWRATAYVRNLFDEEYDETRNFFTPGADVAALKKPRIYGLQLSVRY